MAYPSPRRLQLRRGNTAAVSAYLGAAGELIINTDNNTLYVHDGVTIGGIPATVNTASITSNISSITNGTAVFGNLIPAANVTYSLGNVTHQWNDLYVSNNTIYVGGVPLSIDNTGNLTINGNTIPTVAYVNTAVANVTVDLTAYALNANVTAANVGLKGYVDQANLIQSGQLTQANVGLKGYVDQANSIQSSQLTSANLGIIGYINQGNTIQSQQISAANVGMKGYVDATIRANIANISIPTTYSNANVASYLAVGNVTLGNATIQDNFSQQWQFRDGALIWPDGAGTPNGPSIDGSSNMLVTLMQGGDFEIYATQDITGNTRSWTFDSVGNLTIPDDGVIRSDIDVRVLAETGNIALGTLGGTWMFDNTGVLTTPGTVKTNLISSRTANQRVTIDPDGTTLSYIRVDGYDDGSERVVISNQLTGSLGMYFYTETSTFRMYQNMLGFPDATWQTTAYTTDAVSAYLATHTDQTIGGNLTVQGNLIVNGNVTYISVNNFSTTDNIINLASDNPADSLDLGIVAHRTINSILQHTGLVRDAGDNQWKLFSNVVTAPGTTVDFTNAVYDDLQLGNITSPTITVINNNIAAANAAWAFANTIQSQQLAAANVGIIGYINQANTIQSAQISAANVGIIGYIDQANTIQATAITAANVGLKGYVDFANTVMKAYVDGQIIAANANVSSSGGTNYSNVNVQAYTETMGFKNYSNVNVAVYLGNVSHNINPVPNDIWGLGAENKEWYSAHIKNAYIKETIQAYSGGGYSGGNNGELLKSTGSGIAWQEIKTVNGNSLFGNGDISISGGGSSYGNSNVAAYLPTYSGNIANITLGASGVLTFADGTTQITAGGGSYSNIQVATYLPTYTGIVSASLVNTSGNILATGLSVFGNTRIGLAGAVSGQFHTVVGNITQTSSGGAVYINTTGNVLAAAVVAGAVTSTGTVAVNAATGITTNQTTFLLANATATTINMGGAATTINMGTNTSNVWVGRALGNQTRELLLRAQGTWNTAINVTSNGGFNSPPYANQAVIGGSGTGMTANYSSTGGYITTLTIYNPGTGYQNGDVISVPGGIAGNSFTLTNYSSTLTGNSAAVYTFGIEGNLTVPGNVAARNFIGTIATASQTNITQVGTLGTLTVSGNATVGNLVGVEANTRIIANTYVTTFDIYGNVTFPGNVIATQFIGDGSLLTGIVSGGGGSNYSNANVASYLPVYTGNIASANVIANISMSTPKLGIGTTTPTYAFHLLNTSAGTQAVVESTSNQNNFKVISTAGQVALGTWNDLSKGYVGTVDETSFAIITNNNYQILIDTNGNVGMGNTNPQHRLSVNGNVYTVGNIIVGGTGYTVLPTTVAQFTGNANTYVQLNVQNISTGTDATAEYVATANNGTDTTFFVDMGIANSNYDVNSPNNSLGTTIYPNDSYLYAQGNLATTTGGNLAIGTSTPNKSVKIFAGGINSANIVATVSNTGLAVTGNITATGYIVTTGGYGNITQVDYITANNVVATANVTVQGIGVTMPNRPAFRVNGTSLYGGAQSTANVNLKGVAVSTAYNQGSYFDATTGKFTAPVAGIYEVLLNARVNSSFNGLAQLVVLKNGLNTSGNIVAFWETSSNIGGATHFGVSGTVVLAAGDYLSANILAGNITFDQNDNWSVTYLG